MRRYMCFFCFIITSQSYATELNNAGRIMNLQIPTLANNYSTGYYASRDTYGMRANAVVAAFKANAVEPYDYPIVGFESLRAMGKYRDRDSVGLYADNTSPPFKLWEKIHSANYTPTSFTSPDIDEKKIKPGMLLDTEHNPKWSSYVVSVKSGKVITAGWVNSKTGHLGTPENGVGVTINPLTKIWAANFNIFFPENGKATFGVIQENGIINSNVKNPNAINGIDTVVLPQSKYGGTAAYLSRSADRGYAQQWVYGFISQGSKNSFISSDSANHSPETSFLDQSSSINGLVFEGKNKKNSIVWRSKEIVNASITPEGLISKLGYKTKNIKSNSTLYSDYGRYIIENEQPITLILPDEKDLLPGYTLKITKVSNSKAPVSFVSKNNTSVNGDKKFTADSTQWNKEAIYDGASWYIY